MAATSNEKVKIKSKLSLLSKVLVTIAKCISHAVFYEEDTVVVPKTSARCTQNSLRLGSVWVALSKSICPHSIEENASLYFHKQVDNKQLKMTCPCPIH